MLNKNSTFNDKQIHMFCMDELVPANHILRKINECIDFTFIYNIVKDKYSESNGRPSIDPVVLFKIIFIQYMFGIKSMRQTIKEIEVNIAYRWFLGFNLHDKIPHFSTFGKNYTRRFSGTDIFEKIFENILNQAVNQGFVDDSIQFIDSTHVKAHANRHKSLKVEIIKQSKQYQTELDKEISLDRSARNKKPLNTEKAEKKTFKTISTTDSESGLFHKGEHKEVFAYSVQTSCDKHGWILACKAYAGNLHDSETFIDFYNSKIKETNPNKIVIDAGYKTPYISKLLIEDGIQPVLPYTRPKGTRIENGFRQIDYIYDEYYDCYICPENQILTYTTTNKEGYREYKSNSKICSKCPNLNRCTNSKIKQKLIVRHLWKEYLEKCEEYRYTINGKEEYKKRKETIERIFGTAKECHNFRYTLQIGRLKMQAKTLLTFACMNMMKLAKLMSKNGLKKSRFIVKIDFLTCFRIKIGYL